MDNIKKKSLFELEKRVICGIDEAGRGPIAGPLVVAGVVLKRDLDGLKDSKKLTQKSRDRLFEEIINNSFYHIVIIDSLEIDKNGLSKSIKQALTEIKKYFLDDEVDFIFDGNSSFGVEGITTIIKADDKIPEVSAASILAKVTRDRLMEKYAKIYPSYSFDKHKGYCTKVHLKEVESFGLCPIHRKSFNIPIKSKDKKDRKLFD